MAEHHKRHTTKGETAQNIAVDTTGTVAKVTSAIVGAAALGLVKGLGTALWRSVRPRRSGASRRR
jgi:hypothetical protein